MNTVSSFGTQRGSLRRAVFAGSLAAVLALSGCRMNRGAGVKGSGDIVESVRQVPSFSEIEVNLAFQVTLTTGERTEVVIRSDDNVIDMITTEVSDGRLSIAVDGQVGDATLLADITVPEDSLRAVEVQEAATLSGTDMLRAQAFSVIADDAGRVGLALSADQVVVETDGASSVSVTGQASALEVSAQGASSVQLAELPVATAMVETTGASEAHVNVSDSLVATATGASSILYGGNPPMIEKDAEPASSIEQE